MLLDTGAAGNVMTPRYARALRVTVRRHKSTPYRRSTILGRDLQFWIDTHSSDTASRMGLETGLVGADFLREYVVEVDYAARRVRFLEPRFAATRGSPCCRAATSSRRSWRTLMRRVASGMDRGRIASFLRRDPPLHVFAIGDLDDFYWPYTTWYALEEAGEILQLVLVYGDPPKVLHALTSQDRIDELCELLKAIRRLLPQKLYAHLTLGIAEGLGDAYDLKRRGVLRKMILADRAALQDADPAPVCRLGGSDEEALTRLYRESSPDTSFDARMLATGQFFGVYQHEVLVGAAGVHVYSPSYRAAAIGNVATHPAHRRRGIATAVVGGLCRSLLEAVDHIGLVVDDRNDGAITCFSRLGFVHHASIEACDMSPRR